MFEIDKIVILLEAHLQIRCFTKSVGGIPSASPLKVKVDDASLVLDFG